MRNRVTGTVGGQAIEHRGRLGTRRATEGFPPFRMTIGEPAYVVCEDCSEQVHEAWYCCKVTRCPRCDAKHGLAQDLHVA